MKKLTEILVISLLSMALGWFLSEKLSRDLPDREVVAQDSTAYWAYMEAIDSLSYMKTRIDSFETFAKVSRWVPRPVIVPPMPAKDSDSYRIIDSLVGVLDSIYGSEFSRDTSFVIGDSIAVLDLHTGFRLWPGPVFLDAAKSDLKKILVKEVRTETIEKTWFERNKWVVIGGAVVAGIFIGGSR